MRWYAQQQLLSLLGSGHRFNRLVSIFKHWTESDRTHAKSIDTYQWYTSRICTDNKRLPIALMAHFSGDQLERLTEL